MRILIITPEYLPVQTPAVYRWSAIAEHWAGQGHTVHIVTAKPFFLPGKETQGDVHIHRYGSSTLSEWVKNLFRNKRGTLVSEGRSHVSSGRRGIKNVLYLLYRHTWKAIYWPDGYCIWYFSALHMARKVMQSEQIDALVTVSLPFTCHLVGKTLHARSRSVRWLADMEDPFVHLTEQPQNNRRIYGQLNRKSERGVIGKADCVVVTNSVLKNLYEKEYPVAKGKVRVIPPLYRHVNPGLSRYSGKENDDHIHCAYIGSFYETVREPSRLLRFIRKLVRHWPLGKPLKMHFIGPVQQAFIPQFEEFPDLKGYIVRHGLKSKQEVANMIASMDFLINLGNTTSHQVPSKTVDYYASGSPVIHLSQNPADLFDAFFKGESLYFMYPLFEEEDDGQEMDTLGGFMQMSLGKKRGEDAIKMKLKEHDVQVVAGRYMQLIRGRS